MKLMPSSFLKNLSKTLLQKVSISNSLCVLDINGPPLRNRLLHVEGAINQEVSTESFIRKSLSEWHLDHLLLSIRANELCHSK